MSEMYPDPNQGIDYNASPQYDDIDPMEQLLRARQAAEKPDVKPLNSEAPSGRLSFAEETQPPVNYSDAAEREAAFNETPQERDARLFPEEPVTPRQPIWVTDRSTDKEHDSRVELLPDDDLPDRYATGRPHTPPRSRSLVDGDAPSRFLDNPVNDDPDAFGGSPSTRPPRGPMRRPMAAAGSGDPDPRRGGDDDDLDRRPVRRRHSADDYNDDPYDDDEHQTAAPKKERRRLITRKRLLGAGVIALSIWAGATFCGSGGGFSDDRDGKAVTPDIGCTEIAARVTGPSEKLPGRVVYEYRASTIEKNGAEISRVDYRIDHPHAKDTVKPDLKPLKGLTTPFTITNDDERHIIYAVAHGKTRSGEAITAECKPLELNVRPFVGQDTGN